MPLTDHADCLLIVIDAQPGFYPAELPAADRARAGEALARAAWLTGLARERWTELVTNGRFMRALRAGELPLDARQPALEARRGFVEAGVVEDRERRAQRRDGVIRLAEREPRIGRRQVRIDGAVEASELLLGLAGRIGTLSMTSRPAA